MQVAKGIRLIFLPPYTPELQPAGRLWEIVDEPIVNTYIPDIETLEAIVAKRCSYLANHRQKLEGRTGFHWRPKIAPAK